MDRSGFFMSTIATSDYRGKTNLATQCGFNIPTIPIKNHGESLGTVVLT